MIFSEEENKPVIARIFRIAEIAQGPAPTRGTSMFAIYERATEIHALNLRAAHSGKVMKAARAIFLHFKVQKFYTDFPSEDPANNK